MQFLHAIIFSLFIQSLYVFLQNKAAFMVALLPSDQYHASVFDCWAYTRMKAAFKRFWY